MPSSRKTSSGAQPRPGSTSALPRTLAEAAERARAGDPEAARGLLQAFVGQIDRSEPGTGVRVPRVLCEFVADSLRRLLDDPEGDAFGIRRPAHRPATHERRFTWIDAVRAWHELRASGLSCAECDARIGAEFGQAARTVRRWRSDPAVAQPARALRVRAKETEAIARDLSVMKAHIGDDEKAIEATAHRLKTSKKRVAAVAKKPLARK